MKDFSKICTPARLYFAIAVIATIVALFSGATMMHAFWQIFFAFIWTFILGWLCDKGYNSISWFLVLLPYVLILLAMLNIYHSEDPRRLMRAVKLQGAYGQEAMSGKMSNSSKKVDEQQ
jgi:cytochrome b subunit of formate dehydrogenase